MNNTKKHNPGKPILVHKVGAEGGIEIDSFTGQIISDKATLPDWADGLVAASFGERNGWYQERLGDMNLPEGFTSPDSIAFQDLHWVGLDDKSREISIGADHEFRFDKLAEMLNIDTADIENFGIENAINEAVSTHDYTVNPTDEATLREAEAASQQGDVEQLQKKAVGE